MSLTCLAYGTDQLESILSLIKKIEQFKKLYTVIYFNSTKYFERNLPQEFWDLVPMADVFIYQPINPKYKDKSTGHIIELLKKSCVKIGFPFIYNIGFNALSFILLEEKICGGEEIAKYFTNGFTLEQVLKLLAIGGINFNLEKRYNDCIGNMMVNESKLEIKVTPYIILNINSEKIFKSAYHVHNKILCEVANKVLSLLGIFTTVYSDKELLEEHPCLKYIVSPYEKNAFSLEYPFDKNWLGLYQQFIDIIWKKISSGLEYKPDTEQFHNFDVQ